MGIESRKSSVFGMIRMEDDGRKLFWFSLLVFFTVWNFSFEVRSAVFSPLEGVILILIGLTLFTTPLRRLQEAFPLRYLLPFAAFLLPMIPARLLIVDLDVPPLQAAWRIFRNVFELLPWIFPLVLVHIRKIATVRTLIVVLLILAALSSVVGIVQTLSDGRYLTAMGPHGNFRYLGIFPPLSPKAYPLAHLTLGQKTVITHAPDSDIFRAHGGAASHNHFGAFLIPTLSLTLGLAFLMERRRIALFLLALVQGTALVLSLSRSALAGAAVALGILWIMVVKKKGRFVIVALLTVLIVFSLLTVFRPDIMDVFKDRAVDFLNLREAHGMSSREEIMKLSFKAILEKPVIGHGTGGLATFKFVGVPLSSHNEVLDILYARGVIAFAGWLVLLFLILKDSLKAFRAGSDPFWKAIGAGVFAGMIGISTAGLMQILIHAPDTAALIWLCFGLAAVAGKMTTDHHAP